MKVDAGRKFETRECPSCACEVPENTNRCPICSYEFPTHSSGQRHARSWGIWVMLALFVILVLGLL